ncbi:MAG: flagellar hook assembly protein FlgD [Desulfovibrio sp.]|jgi:flagellar basal-body rod modification protein FlgD|nr:flagellar hook assembly protein FlgD [Desulfovibrio sp.]
MAIDAILGQAEKAAETQTNKVTSDKEMFLKLLVAQLTYQDPLNPQEDKEFIAQLAQFTQVEELQNINSNVQGILSNNEKNQLISAVNLIGARVAAKGDTIVKYQAQTASVDDNGDQILDANGDPVLTTTTETLPFYYSSPYAVVSCTLSIRDAGTNAIVYTEELGVKAAGTQYGYQWDGKNSAGEEVANGAYIVSFSAKDASGNSQLIDTEIFGDVFSVEVLDGNHILHLKDGRSANYTDVTMVGVASSSNY